MIILEESRLADVYRTVWRQIDDEMDLRVPIASLPES